MQNCRFLMGKIQNIKSRKLKEDNKLKEIDGLV